MSFCRPEPERRPTARQGRLRAKFAMSAAFGVGIGSGETGNDGCFLVGAAGNNG